MNLLILQILPHKLESSPVHASSIGEMSFQGPFTRQNHPIVGLVGRKVGSVSYRLYCIKKKAAFNNAAKKPLGAGMPGLWLSLITL